MRGISLTLKHICHEVSQGADPSRWIYLWRSRSGGFPLRAETRRGGVRARQPNEAATQVGEGFTRLKSAEWSKRKGDECCARGTLIFSGSSWMRSSTCGHLLSLGKVSKRREPFWGIWCDVTSGGVRKGRRWIGVESQTQVPWCEGGRAFLFFSAWHLSLKSEGFCWEMSMSALATMIPEEEEKKKHINMVTHLHKHRGHRFCLDCTWLSRWRKVRQPRGKTHEDGQHGGFPSWTRLHGNRFGETLKRQREKTPILYHFCPEESQEEKRKMPTGLFRFKFAWYVEESRTCWLSYLCFTPPSLNQRDVTQSHLKSLDMLNSLFVFSVGSIRTMVTDIRFWESLHLRRGGAFPPETNDLIGHTTKTLERVPCQTSPRAEATTRHPS